MSFLLFPFVPDSLGEPQSLFDHPPTFTSIDAGKSTDSISAKIEYYDVMNKALLCN